MDSIRILPTKFYTDISFVQMGISNTIVMVYHYCLAIVIQMHWRVGRRSVGIQFADGDLLAERRHRSVIEASKKNCFD